MLNKLTQQQVLHYISNDLNLLDEFKMRGLNLDKDMFNLSNKKVFDVIKKSKNEGYDKLTVDFLMNNGVQFGIKEMEINKNDFLDLTLKVRNELEDTYLKETKNKLNTVFKEYMNSSIEDRTDKKDKLMDVINSSKTTQRVDNTLSITELVDKKLQYTENSERIPSFLNELDENILKGGFSRRGIHVVSAFPGNGKTTLGVQMGALQATNGYKVLFLSLEQPSEKIMSNVLSVLSEEEDKGRSYWETSKLTEDTTEQKRNEAFEVINNVDSNNFYIDDTRFDTQKDFIERVRRACLFEEYDVVIIDNFQNSPKPKDFYQVETAYSGLADELLNIALHEDNKSMILALSQLTNSNGYEKTKYSARLNEHAISNLKIELTEKDENSIEETQTVDIHSLKSRDGKQGETETFTFLGSRSIIGSFDLPIKNEVLNKRKVKAEKDRKEREEREEREREEHEKMVENGELPF